MEDGIWVDCIIKVVGWFQISDSLNPNTNNYLPESSNGSPVSGNGWVAYEKPGAQPGDIIIIYKVITIPFDGATLPNVNYANVLWDLINPHGLDYFYSNHNLKYAVNRTDLISQFPHAGGPYTPINPDNPTGLPDIIWTKATSYYGIPGPGNATNPQFVRRAIPSFGVRLTIWTDNCCVANEIVSLPPDPPTIDPPPPPPPPHFEGLREFDSTATAVSESGVISLQEQSYKPGKQGAAYGSNNKGDNPSFRKFNNRGDKKYTKRVPGTSPLHWNLNQSYSQSVYDAESSTYGIKTKSGPIDIKEVRNAIPIGDQYQLKIDDNIDINIFNNRKNQFLIAATEETLNNLGLISQSNNGLKSSNQSYGPSNNTRGSLSNVNSSTQLGSEDQYKKTADFNRIISDIDAANIGVDKSTIGGFKKAPSFNTSFSSYYIAKYGIQPRNSEVLNTQNSKIDKDLKSDNKGRLNTTLGGITERGISINNGIRTSLYNQGYLNSQQKRIKGIDISKASKSHGNIYNEGYEDPSRKYSINHGHLRAVGDTGPAGVITVIKGNNLSTKQTIVFKQTFVVNTRTSSYGITLSSYPMVFGVVNPVMPGTYVIATPTCIPSQGYLPDIIANGETWIFSQLISTLQTLEGVLITQQVVNYLPTVSGDADVISPNRLPIGLMRDLEFTSTENSTYEGTISHGGADQYFWWQSEPAVILERSTPNTNSTVSIVLKATATSLSQDPPIKPLMELYNDTNLLTTSNPITSFVGGPCSALPGWYDVVNATGLSNGGSHTACPGGAGYGGAGGTSAFNKNSLGTIISGPYNPGIYGGSHHNFLCFKYDSANGINDSSYIGTATNYRLRVYNNGIKSDLNGYAIYTAGLKVKSASASISVDTGNYLYGSITTYHCNQLIRVRNTTRNKEIDRYSNYYNGNIDLGSGSFAGFGANLNLRLEAYPGDSIEVYRPGYDNLYSSRNLIGTFTV